MLPPWSHGTSPGGVLEGACAGILEPYNLRQSLLRFFVFACVSCQSGSDQRTRAAAGVAAWWRGPPLVAPHLHYVDHGRAWSFLVTLGVVLMMSLESFLMLVMISPCFATLSSFVQGCYFCIVLLCLSMPPVSPASGWDLWAAVILKRTSRAVAMSAGLTGFLWQY